MSYYDNAVKLRAAMDDAGAMLTDEQAIAVPELYKKWQADTEYAAGDRRLHQNVLYSCLQPHTSQAAWTPDAAPSLWAKVLITDPNVTPEWEQPDSTNPYMAGDTVTHNGKTWVSDLDNNVWEPGVYGWTEVTV